MPKETKRLKVDVETPPVDHKLSRNEAEKAYLQPKTKTLLSISRKFNQLISNLHL